MLHYQPKSDLLNGKIILVTGAGAGIGREAALTYARYGAKLILLGRTESKLKDLQQQIAETYQSTPLIYTLDLLTATDEQCQAFAADLAQQVPCLDGVLHNAGLLGVVAPISEQPAELWHQVMQVNVNATFMLTQALLPLLLRSTSASLIFTSSSVGKQGRANWGHMLSLNLPPKA